MNKQKFIKQIQKAFDLREDEAEAIAVAVFDMQAYHPDTILAEAIRLVCETNLSNN